MQAKLNLCVLAITLFSQVAFADKVDDFKEAVTKTGCDSIPYSDQRSGCRTQQSYVDEWCKGSRGPTSCKSNVKDDLLRAQVREYSELDSLTNKRREAQDKRSRATDDAEKKRWTDEVNDLDRKIDASKRVLERLDKEVETHKHLVDQTIDTLKKCIDYREAVMNIFSYATDKVRGDASDPDVRPHARTLMDLWAGEIEGHRKQIVEKGNAVETCKKERP